MITRQQIEQKLRVNDRWVERAIVALYRRQTQDEQTRNTTEDSNEIGFNKADARMGGYLARWIMTGKPLSGKWIISARTITIRYSQQLADIANAATVSQTNTVTVAETNNA